MYQFIHAWFVQSKVFKEELFFLVTLQFGDISFCSCRNN